MTFGGVAAIERQLGGDGTDQLADEADVADHRATLHRADRVTRRWRAAA